MLDIKFKLRPGHTSEREWMKLSKVKTLFWNVTADCNYFCNICFSDSPQARPDELSTEEAFRLIDLAQDAGIEDIIISGGEPFLRDDLIGILSKISKCGMSIRIATNGSLLTEELIERMRNETLVKSFQISLDTLDPQLYSRFHGTDENSIDKLFGTLRLLMQAGFHTTVSTRLHPLTISGMTRILDVADSEGWKTVTAHIPLNTCRAEGAWPQESDYILQLMPAFKHFLSLKNHWLVETFIPWIPFHPAIKELEKDIRFVHRGCSAGRDHLTVSASGKIVPCVCLDLPQALIGDIHLDKPFSSLAASRVVEMFRHPSRFELCSDCSHVTICGAGCRAAAFVLSGRLDGQDISCPLRMAEKQIVKQNG